MITSLIVNGEEKILNIDLDSRDLEAINVFLENPLAQSAIVDRLEKTGEVQINLGYKKVDLMVLDNQIVLKV